MADGAEPINFFGSNATTTRHFAEEEGDSDDEETQRTDPDSAVRALRAWCLGILAMQPSRAERMGVHSLKQLSCMCRSSQSG